MAHPQGITHQTDTARAGQHRPNTLNDNLGFFEGFTRNNEQTVGRGSRRLVTPSDTAITSPTGVVKERITWGTEFY
ncbi:MAG: hypothetical protein ACJAYE_003089 [Candidatus Azotimanducaceae bacterium]|jgi:hypothetical protein